MTGWPPGLESLYACEDYAPSTGILGQVTPGICDKWLGARCNLRVCPWAGQPPVKRLKAAGQWRNYN